MKRRAAKTNLLVCAAIFVAVLIAFAGHGQVFAQTFQTLAPNAILVDAGSGTVLYEKAADELITPASMVKIVTASVIFEEIVRGRVKLDNEMVVSENAWRRGGGRAGGSTMFAGLGARIKVSDLLQGLIVQSGNDAAIVLAEGVAGSEANFARLMTDRARELGLKNSTFRNASGMADPLQKTTARDLAKISIHMIEAYPDLYRYFGQKEFTWNKIRQQNRNPLLTMDIGADGLKTGNIDESGYGLVGSAVQDGQRLIVVVSGLGNARDRGVEARKLLEWGFRAFDARQLFAPGDTISEAKVFGGDRGGVELVAKSAVRLLIPRGSSERVVAKVIYTGPVRAPIAKGAEIARLRVTRGEVQALDIPLYARDEVPTGSMTRRAWDALWELTGQWGRQAVSKALETRS
jgi:serine-type D-Ala-D-Ala carboxypeptidase (penicillin-binding protein 5/6)